MHTEQGIYHAGFYITSKTRRHLSLPAGHFLLRPPDNTLWVFHVPGQFPSLQRFTDEYIWTF